MEGRLAVAPGTKLDIGYALSVPSNTAPVYFSMTSAQVLFRVHCVSGTPSASSFTASLSSYTFSFADSSWYPTATQTSPSSIQGSVSVPNLCHGGKVLLDQGGTFSATPA